MNARRFSPALIAAAVAAALVGGYVYARYAAAIRAQRARVGTGSRIAETPCGAIEYAVRGSGSPVLVVHGAGGGYDQALEFSEPLERSGFCVVAMSRFGYLRTPLPIDASAAAQADAHACLMDALGIERAAIIGASAGAPSAMQFALRHPERCSSLVLLVPAAYVPRPGNAPALKTPAGTEFLFDVALRSDFLVWLAPRIARSLVIRAILAMPPSVVTRPRDLSQRRTSVGRASGRGGRRDCRFPEAARLTRRSTTDRERHRR